MKKLPDDHTLLQEAIAWIRDKHKKFDHQQEKDIYPNDWKTLPEVTVSAASIMLRLKTLFSIPDDRTAGVTIAWHEHYIKKKRTPDFNEYYLQLHLLGRFRDTLENHSDKAGEVDALIKTQAEQIFADMGIDPQTGQSTTSHSR